MTETSNESENQTGKSREGANDSKRKGILFGVLALMLAMLGYDYRIARPAVDRAYNKIDRHVAQVNRASTERVSNHDVRTLLGKEPSRSFNDGSYLVEVFSWRSGLPIRTHDLFAVYTPSGDKQLFYRHAMFVYESSGEVAPVPENFVNAEDPDAATGDSDHGQQYQPLEPGNPSHQERGRPEFEADEPAEANEAENVSVKD